MSHVVFYYLWNSKKFEKIFTQTCENERFYLFSGKKSVGNAIIIKY